MTPTKQIPLVSELIPVEAIEQSEAAEDASLIPSVDELVPVENTGWGREFGYNFAKNLSDVNSATIIAEAWMPLGNLYGEEGFGYYSPEEVYGKEFMDADFDTRRQILVDTRNAELTKEYADVIASDKAYGNSTSAEILGSLGGALATPTSLVPMGAGYKGMAAMAGLLGAEYSALSQFATKGEVDKFEVLKTAAVSAVAAPLVVFGAKQGFSLVTKGKNKATNAKAKDVEEANEILDVVDQAYGDAVLLDKGIEDGAALAHVIDITGLTSETIYEAARVAARNPIVPTKAAAKLANAVAKEGTDMVARVKNPGIDAFISTVSRTVGKVSSNLKLRFRDLDRFETKMMSDKSEIIKPFAKLYQGLSDSSKKLTKRFLNNGDFKAARNIFDSVNPEGGKYFDDVESMLKITYKELIEEAGFKIGKIANYFPRSVKDLNALRASLGKEEQDAVQRLMELRKKELSTKDNVITELSSAEEATVMNNYLRGLNRSDSRASWKKDRTLNRLNDELLTLYDDPIEALTSYVRTTTTNISRNKFFGKGVAKAEGEALNLESSIGALMTKLKGTIADSDFKLVEDGVKARFIEGTQSGGKLNQIAKNLGYITTLANPFSAIVQLGDIALSARANGVINTLVSLAKKKSVSTKDFGLEKAAAELNTTEKLSGAMDKLFTISLFKAVDRLGKNTFINASLRKGAQLSKTEKGVKKLREKYGDAFEDRFDLLVDDLKSGAMSEDVKLYLWSELADMQPIGLSEYPLKYLQNPNGRIFYSLKTYTLKQLDYVRETIVDEVAKGNYATAGKNTMLYLALVPTASTAVGLLKDAVLKRPVDLEDEIGDRYVDNILKVVGASEYLADKFNDGKFGDLILEPVLPPLDYLNHVGDLMMTSISKAGGDTEAEYDLKLLNSLPLVGRFMYNFMGGGLEKYIETKDKEEKKELKKRYGLTK